MYMQYCKCKLYISQLWWGILSPPIIFLPRSSKKRAAARQTHKQWSADSGFPDRDAKSCMPARDPAVYTDKPSARGSRRATAHQEEETKILNFQVYGHITFHSRHSILGETKIKNCRGEWLHVISSLIWLYIAYTYAFKPCTGAYGETCLDTWPYIQRRSQIYL